VEIHIAGFKAIVSKPHYNIHFYPLFNFRRISIQRIWAPWKFYKLLLKVRPQTIIVTTHELLVVTIIYKILFGCRIIYDVQENYFRNIWYGRSFPWLLKHLLAPLVRLKEILSRSFVSHYILAERNYEKEFSFSKGKSTVIENKARKPFAPKARFNPEERIRFLFSGTLAETYGVFEAIALTKALHQLNPRISLAIIGFSPQKKIYERLLEEIKNHHYIHLIGGDNLVPHPQILKEIENADIGLLPYHPDKSTMNCIPTKLYEYLAYRLPMIITQNPLWKEIISQYKAGISIDFYRFDPSSFLHQILTEKFYEIEPEEDIYWESQEEKLFQIIEK
jgi:glycosyltransferase involved in cell wall biosynthesis